MPQSRSSSGLPTVFVVLACASIAGYFMFFRGKSGAEPVAAAAETVPGRGEGPAPRRLAEPPPETRPAPKPEPKEEVKPAPKPEPGVQKSAAHEIAELCAQGRWREARAKLAPLFVSPLSDPERLELARRGIEISERLLQGEEKDVELYEIKQGDTLEGIAKKFKTLNGVKGAIMLVNNYKENQILRDGRKIRVTHGTWSLVADKSLYKLWICYEGAPFKAYSITIGAPGKETPAAKFTVGGKNPKPAWWPPSEVKVSGKVPVPYGDPQNPLGEWWIALDHDLHHGIGVHGTNDPGSIGSKASNGCIRMLNPEVVDVAAVAYKGMSVTIVE